MGATEAWNRAQEQAKTPGSRVLNAWLASGGAKGANERRANQGLPQANAQGVLWDSQEFGSWVRGGLDSAGVVVDERTAMSISAVYACVALIGGAIATLPLQMYQRQQNGDRMRVTPALWWLLNEQPHPRWAAAPFWEYLSWALLLHGDSFAEIVRPGNRSPDVAGFLPWHPRAVEVNVVDGRLKYTLSAFNGTDDNEAVRTVDQDDMIHVPGPGFDGRRGLSPIRYTLRTPAGIALAADEFSAAFFKNGARPDFALTMPGKPSEDQKDTLRKTWIDRYGGPSKSHLPVILTGGLDVKSLTMPIEDTQLIATRGFQVEDIARIFGIPPFMIGHNEKTSSWGTGVEQMSIGFVKYTLQRHLVKFEQEFNRKLWPTRTQYFTEFNVAGLLRADAAGRAAYFRAALGGSAGPGWMTQDEVRGMENQTALGGEAGQLTKWSAGNAQSQPAQAAGG